MQVQSVVRKVNEIPLRKNVKYIIIEYNIVNTHANTIEQLSCIAGTFQWSLQQRSVFRCTKLIDVVPC
jgi:hypothetical protein